MAERCAARPQIVTRNQETRVIQAMKTHPIPLVVRLTQALACPVWRCLGAAGAQFRWRHPAVVGAPLGLALGLSQLAQAEVPIIVQQPSGQTVYVGASVTFRIRATTTDGSISFQWQRDDPTVPVTFTNIVNAKRNFLTLLNVTLEHAGDYRVMVANAAGDSVASDVARLEVRPAPFTKVTEGPVVTDAVTSWAGMFADYDGDGLLDLVVLGNYGGVGKNTRLYHNEGQGQFRAVTDSPWDSLTDRVLYSPWADPDNDGDLDLLLVGHESDQPIFMENAGGGDFTRHTVGTDWTSNQIQIRGWAAAWGDIDNDGLLDAVVGAYTTYPMRNNGDGTFTAMTKSVVYGSTHCYQLIDYDGDGDLDLFMPEEYSTSRLYRNEGQWEFTNVTYSVLQNRLGNGLNGAWADFDNDGDLDLYFMGYESGPDRFLVNNGDGTFADWDGLPSTLLQVGNGMPVWGDYDNDGFLDLLVTGPDHCRLFRHSGVGSFVEVTAVHPTIDPSNAQSAAWADYDNDGDLDLFVAGVGRPGYNYLYQNNGNGNHWLKVRLNGTGSNSHGVGAEVFARTTEGLVARQMRQIQAQSVIQEMEAHFGLGNAPIVTSLRVEWPSGAVQELSDVAVDQIVTLWEPPALTAAVQPDGACVLSIRAEPNQGWQIQASGDLAEWQTLTTMTSGTIGFEFVDSAASGMDCRYYRVIPE